MSTVNGPEISRTVRLGGLADPGVEGWSGPGRRRCATDTPGIVPTALEGSAAFAAAVSAACRVMTAGMTGYRRRAAVSVSLPVATSDPVDQLDRVLEACHHVNRALPKTTLGREELIALGGLLTQLSAALLTLTDLLGAPAHHYDRTRLRQAGTGPLDARLPGVTGLLRDCRDGFLAAYTAARAFHADLRRHGSNGAHRNGWPGGSDHER